MTYRHPRYWGSEHPDPQHGPLKFFDSVASVQPLPQHRDGLYASLRAGDTVTLTVAAGQFTGRARYDGAVGEWLAVHGDHSEPITALNLIGISRRLP